MLLTTAAKLHWLFHMIINVIMGQIKQVQKTDLDYREKIHYTQLYFASINLNVWILLYGRVLSYPFPLWYIMEIFKCFP